MAVSPSIVSGRVVATMIFSSASTVSHQHGIALRMKTDQTRILYGICKRRDDPKFKLLLGIVTRNAQKGPFLKLLLFNLGKRADRNCTERVDEHTSRLERVVLRRTHQLTSRLARYMIPSSCRRQKFSITAFESCWE
jgi:hypothetical protein